MGFNYTEDQTRVLEVRNKNVLVSAAAGSGKTAVLVERIARLVCDKNNKTDIDELLVVTFMKAAAAEMKERIHRKISEKIEEFEKAHPADENGRQQLSADDKETWEHLQKQYALVHRAMITTIDSFCQNVLRNHFQEISFDPDFRVMEEAEKSLLKQDVLAELLEQEYANGDESFLYAVEYFTAGNHTDDGFAKLVLDLEDYADGFARPVKYLESRRDGLESEAEEITDASSPMGAFLLRYLKDIVSDCAEVYAEMLDICREELGADHYLKYLEPEYDALRLLTGINDFNRFGEELANITFATLSGKSARLEAVLKENPELKDIADQKKKEVQNLRTAVKKTINNLKDNWGINDFEKTISVVKASAPALRELIDITIKFHEALKARKREEKIADFSDVEHYALEILEDENGQPTDVALEYRDHFKEVMVDEYQDSNEIQERLIEAISSKTIGHYDRFMVGDIKQSIYGFRQARPDIFNEKYKTYPGEEGCERIDLSKNFRSRGEVLESVNDVFDYIMHGSTGGVEYDEASRLNLGADYSADEEAPEGMFKTELVLFDSKMRNQIVLPGMCGTEEFDEDEEEESKGAEGVSEDDAEIVKQLDMQEEFADNECEAVVLANIIRELMNNQTVLRIRKDGDREIRSLEPVEYRDIVILHRSPSGLAESIGTVFERYNIPVSISQGGGYYSTREIKQLLQFIRTIDNPLQDIPLYGSLTSVFGGYTAAEVAEFKAKCPEGSLYDAVKNGAPEFIEKLNHYRDMAVYHTIRELLQIIIDDHDYSEYVAALPAGEKRRANVEMLLSRASDYEKTNYFGLHQFVRYMDQLQKYTEDRTAEADVLGENANVVRFTSIHKSKGLEYPVTILAGAGKQFNFTDAGGAVVYNTELGIACDYIDLENRTKTGTLTKSIIKEKIRQDNIAEEMRLLYVAMTRAKEKLIIVGKSSKAGEKLEKALTADKKPFTYAKFTKAKSYLDFLLPVVSSPNFSTRLFTMRDVIIDKAVEQLSLADMRAVLANSDDFANRDKLAEISERLSYEYPYRYLEKLYTKTTVSELKMAAMLDENETAHEKFTSREQAVYVPEFRREKGGITGTVRGDSYHRVMEIMDFDRVLGSVCGCLPGSYEEFLEKAQKSSVNRTLDEFMKEMLGEHRISAECYEAVNKHKICEFLLSNLSYRMWRSNASKGLRREQPFVLSVSADKVDINFPEQEKLIIQGIIDAYFVEDGKVILMDYKTDAADTDEEFISRYHTQLDYYQEAIEKLTGYKVSERIMYSFHMGKEIKDDY